MYNIPITSFDDLIHKKHITFDVSAISNQQ